MSEKAFAGKMFVETQYPTGVVSEHTQLEVATFPEEVEVAHVSAKFGLTISLAPYESARIDVGVSLPCYPEELDRAMESAVTRCQKKVSELTTGVKGIAASVGAKLGG